MKHMDYKKLGERIFEERSRKDVTQDQLAEMIESSNVVLSRIENSGKVCSIDYMVNIANALGVSANTLLIDSLDYPDKTPEEIEVAKIFADCSPEERAILLRTMEYLRKILKGYTIR